MNQDPARWVWLHQQPLVISHFESDTRWPEGVRVARELGINTLVLVPHTNGDHRLGVGDQLRGATRSRSD